MSSDIRRIREPNCIFIKSDKSSNLYEIDKNKYRQMILKEVIKHYKKAPPNFEKELNSEAKMLASKLGIVDRVEKNNIKIALSLLKTIKVTLRRTLNVD